MAAPFTPFHPNGSVNSAAVLPLAKLFKEPLPGCFFTIFIKHYSFQVSGSIISADPHCADECMTLPGRELVACVEHESRWGD